MLKKFQRTTGKYIEKIYGQERLAYAISDSEEIGSLHQAPDGSWWIS